MRVDFEQLAPFLTRLRSAGLVLSATAEVPPVLGRLTPGEQIRAEVLAELGGNRTLVRIAGEPVALELPQPIRPGSFLELTFVAARPRLTFALTTGQHQGVQLQLSETGRWLGLPPPADDNTTETAPLPRLSQLFDAIPADPARIAARLQEVVTKSGLFYESHLAEWATGQRQLPELLDEPQGTLSPLLREPAETTTQPSTPTPGDPRTLPLVREQLALLAGGEFIWRGEGQQGEPLSWRIRSDDEASGETGRRAWSTAIELELPHLGRVQAELRLVGRELRVTVLTSSAEASANLTRNAGPFRAALATAGLLLAGLEVHHEEPAAP